MNSFDFTQDITSHIDSQAAIQMEDAQHAPHGYLTKRNTQFAIKRERANLILKSLFAIIATVAIALVVVRCIRKIKPNAQMAHQYRRLSDEDPCLTKFGPLPENESNSFRSTYTRPAVDDVSTTQSKDKCDASNKNKTETDYINVAMADVSSTLLDGKKSTKTMRKRVTDKVKKNKKTLIVATVVAAVVVIALAVSFSQTMKGDAADEYAPQPQSFSAPDSDSNATVSDPGLTSDVTDSEKLAKFDLLFEKYNNMTKSYNILDKKYDILNEKFKQLTTKYDQAKGNEMFTVMTKLQFFRSRLWAGIHDCNDGVQSDFDGNILYYLMKEWREMPYLKNTLNVDSIYDAMTKITEMFIRDFKISKEFAKPHLITMVKSLEFLKP